MPDPSVHIPDNSPRNYLHKLLIRLLETVDRWLANTETAKRNRVLMLITAAFLTLVLMPSQHLTTALYLKGEIATSDIRANQDYLLEDQQLTAQLREEAANNSPLVYTVSSNAAITISNSFKKALTAVTDLQEEKSDARKSELSDLLESHLEIRLSDAELGALLKIRKPEEVLLAIRQQLNELYKQWIVLDAKVFNSDLQRGIELRDAAGKSAGTLNSKEKIVEIAEARRILLESRLEGLDNNNLAHHLLNICSRMIKPNILYNQDSSEARKSTAVDAVKPVLYRIQKGEMIVRTGDRVTQEQAKKLQMIYQASRGEGTVYVALGIFGLVLILFYFPYRFACRNIRKFNPTNRDILTIAIMLLSSTFVFKLSLLITANIGAAFPAVSAASYYYLFPFAAGAMLVRMLLNSEIALVFSVVLAPLLGILFNGNMYIVIYALLGSLVGAHGVRQCRDRNSIYAAGSKLAVVNLAMVICFQTISGALFTMQTIYIAVFALAGALISAMLVSAFTPIFESLFHYTTNIKLLELANLNSPLLRELMIKAPGTYHHSVIVGNLVEAAAEAIGANPLLARVAAYYHDIGKVAKPLYFIENTQGGENRHDKLSPNMSALILISHVKEGEAMARAHRLGQPIIDVIRQHHGTSLIRFFYDKARQQAESSGQPLDEQDYHYPGPKPQTREAGLVMLADAVEAASRTLSNPTPDRIQGMVQKLVNRIFTDGQLDECELTLKNLHEIAKSFNRILCAIYHHRIEYPEPVHKTGSGGKKADADNGTKPAATPSGSAKNDQDGNTENLKRLGIS